uniref:CBP domain-containing protein n=1 Tax=Macrostomum lignano TaxID=282301 RepID=A0A1I8F7C4_9PLAT
MKVAAMIAFIAVAALVTVQLTDASLAEEGPNSHQMFRFKKGFHFFDCASAAAAAQGCMINDNALEGMEMVVKAARSGKLCNQDKQMLRVFLASLLL